MGDDLRRTFTSPFEARGARPLLVHCGHHKAGTVWFRSVLLTVCRHYGLRHRNGNARPVAPDADMAFFHSSGVFDVDLLGDRPFRGSHMVRDPRDLVVSGYEYHLVTEEAWALHPEDHYGGLSYQSRLRGLNEHDGLMAEIEWVASGTAVDMAAWNYDRPEFLELRYEDVIADEAGAFDRLFRWYGFSERAVAFGLESVDRLSLRRGGAQPSHVRSGRPGEWRSRLGPDHIAAFKELTGDLVVRLGYEATSDW